MSKLANGVLDGGKGDASFLSLSLLVFFKRKREYL
jgi:hypothetical protein